MACISYAHDYVVEKSAPADRAVVEEFHRSFVLAPGAEVEVSSVGAEVTVETTDADTAELHVVRRGSSRAELARHSIAIETSPSHLVLRVESPDAACDASGDAVQEVTLLLPRSASLHTIQTSAGCAFG
jgi:hypothetical protein